MKKNEPGYCKCPSSGRGETRQGQGAIEYLLLLAASVVVVAIVITFLMQSLESGTDTGRLETYELICVTLNSKTEECMCYREYLNPAADDEIEIADCCASTKLKQDLIKAIDDEHGCP